MQRYTEKLKTTLDSIDYEKVEKLVKLVNMAWTGRKTVFVCGNGGSALTAQHYAVDWGKCMYTETQRPISVKCLNDNIGIVTAWANDSYYEDVFQNQLLSSEIHQGDILILISGSGNSDNLLKAINVAQEKRIRSFGIVGFDGGLVKSMADDCIHVAINDMQVFEDISLSIGHYVMRELIGKV